MAGEVNPGGVLVQLHPGGRERLKELFRGFVLIDARAPGTLRAWSSLRAMIAVSAVGPAALALASVVHARLLARRVQTVEFPSSRRQECKTASFDDRCGGNRSCCSPPVSSRARLSGSSSE
jgi:hypothetical protein